MGGPRRSRVHPRYRLARPLARGVGLIRAGDVDCAANRLPILTFLLRETLTEVSYSVPGSPDAASPAGVQERVAVTGRNRGIARPGHACVAKVDFDADGRPAGCVVPDPHESDEFYPAEIAGGTTTSVSTMSAPAARARRRFPVIGVPPAHSRDAGRRVHFPRQGQAGTA